MDVGAKRWAEYSGIVVLRNSHNHAVTCHNVPSLLAEGPRGLHALLYPPSSSNGTMKAMLQVKSSPAGSIVLSATTQAKT